MTTFAVSEAFEEGLARERGLCVERDAWTRDKWLVRKEFLEGLIDEEIADGGDSSEIARLKGRLAVVCLEGQRRFGR